MKKLILRLLVVILLVSLGGSVGSLLATEWGHSHGPAPGPAPPPPPPPPTTPTPPSAPPMLDSKLPPGPQISPPRDTGGGGCGGAAQPTTSQPMVAESPPPMDFSKPPAPGGVCHDYVGDRIGVPPPKNGTYRSYGEITTFLEDPKNGYRPGTPSDNLPAGTVVQFGGAHVGIVGPDGRIHHYTQAAPSLGIPASVNVNNSIAEITNTTRTWIDPGTGNKVTNQPYINTPVRVFLPPSKSKP
jgi:hypothetical protein